MNASGARDAGRSTGRLLAIVLASGLALRLVLLGATSGLPPRIADEQSYLALATSLADGRGYASESGPTSLRPPLYPALVASLWTLSGTRSLQLVRAVQVLLGLVMAVVVYRLGRDLFDERTGALAAALVWFYPPLVFSTYLLLTETLFTCLVVFVLAAYRHTLARDSGGAAFGTGTLIGLAALTRSVLWPFAPVLAVVTLLVAGGTPRRRLALGALLLAGWAVTLAPWAVRNTRLWGMPVVVDTMGGLNLRMGNYEFTPNDRIWDAVSKRGEESWVHGLPPSPPGGGTWNEAQKERWARDQAVAYMAAHPGETALRAAIKLGDFWALDRDFAAGIYRGLYEPPAWFAVPATAAMLLAHPLVIVLAVVGAWARPPSDWRFHLTAWLLVGFVCALHVIVFAHPRYRLPLTPIFCLYAGSALAGRAWRPAAWPARLSPVPAVALAALAGTWLVQFAWRDWPQAARTLRMLVSG
ncbi:MAG TPA: glycosyltransferase family 39 protein [Methylomirabilota bacterium]